MRLHSVTLRQKLGKVELADYFYSRVLELPGRRSMGDEAVRWFEAPVHLAVQPISWGEDPQSVEGFTGVQLNVMPASRIDELVAVLEQTGQKVGEPRQVGDIRLIQVRDASGNVLMLLGRDERPDEPLIDEAVGSLSIFVSDLGAARAFYVDALGLGVHAEPHPGLLVLGETGTVLMLYAAEGDSQATPMGRRTHIGLADDDLEASLEKVEAAGGKVLDRATAPADNCHGAPSAATVIAATIADPDGNELIVFSEEFLAAQGGGDDEKSEGESEER